MTLNDAKKIIIKEYPFFSTEQLKIVKQFVSPDGRTYNAFLIESSREGFKKFIAKSIFYKQSSLDKEFKVLNIINKYKINAPKLLIPKHKPRNFLLLEYIEGILAEEALSQGYNAVLMFKKLGELTGKVNSIEVDTFGDLLNPSSITWKEYQLERLNHGIPIIKSLLEDDLFEKLTEMIDSLKYVLDEESKGKPRLVHHDFWFDNFILRKEDEELFLLDFAIAFGGRPIYDLAKFYIWVLCNYPTQQKIFLDSYSKYIELPDNFNDVLKFYTIRELLGMADFFTIIKDEKMQKETIDSLKELINEQGKLYNLFA